jgi:hypothetical protein
MRLLQVVPRLEPSLGGVGGYAAALARALGAHGIESSFLGIGAGDLDAAPLRDRAAAAFQHQLAASGAESVLVHYVSYGYDRRGCPSWLVEGIERWRSSPPRLRLVTLFHEVYASGPPWRSSFWLSPVQRRLAARLLRASDGAATTLDLYGRMLARWRPRREPMVMPVFSTVGEPETVAEPEEREPRVMVVFGGSGNRRRAYDELPGALAAASRALGIAEILDVGPALAALPAEVNGVPVRALGPLPEREVSAVLLRSFAGFLAYRPALLAKSTVFASYCAHGLVPVCGGVGRELEPAPDRPPFWDPTRQPPPRHAAGLAREARAWYAGHSLVRQAACFRELLAAPAASDPLAARRS